MLYTQESDNMRYTCDFFHRDYLSAVKCYLRGELVGLSRSLPLETWRIDCIQGQEQLQLCATRTWLLKDIFIADFGVTLRKLNRNVPSGTSVKQNLQNFDCPEEFGYYPHPTDCTQYYVCVFGGALLESCTGGLMYSHDLQTCDWPRNVGCNGEEEIAVSSAPSRKQTQIRDEVPEQRVRYTVAPQPPPAQPAAVTITSRGQPKQLHHQHEITIKVSTPQKLQRKKYTS